MSGPANLVVTDGAGARQALADLVMAWARDSATGEPRYIHELDAKHRGASCGCECVSCGVPLTAVNAAKAVFRKRPHFRHPEGASRDDCMVLAARAAVLRQLQVDGWLQLPRRMRSGKVEGLSGRFYEAWVEAPPEKLHVRNVDYRDRAAAVITFDDGRQLRVQLVGTAGNEDGEVDADGLPIPTIILEVDDPAVATMAPEELRRRLTLMPDVLCWRGHWKDAELEARAKELARIEAVSLLDQVPEGLELPDGMDPTLKRETVLHFEVKRILAEAESLAVPGLDTDAKATAPDGRVLYRRWSVGPHRLSLSNLKLETRFGRVIPDVSCRAWQEESGELLEPLFIEVTVTNPIDEERLDRIRAAGPAALEIDLSRAGGWVTGDELRRLVVEEVAAKKWLHHPALAKRREELQSKLAGEVAREQGQLDLQVARFEERRARIRVTPLSDICAEYLGAVTAMLDAGADSDAVSLEVEDGGDGGRLPLIVAVEEAARERVADAADKMALHGYPEAADENLIGWHGILARVLSLQLARPVGYRLDNVMGVLNAIRQDKGPRRSDHSLFFIAVRTYLPHLTLAQWRWFESWAAEVKDSIRREETTYLRHPAYDRILAVLFPEMADALRKPGAKLRVDVASSGAVHAHGHSHGFGRPAQFIVDGARADQANWLLLDTRPGEFWLKGRDLARSKLGSPRQPSA